MADPVSLGLILAATGAAKSYVVDAPKADRQRKLRAEETRYSGWTGRAPTTQVQEADPFGSALTYGVGGAQLGQGMQKNDAENALLKKVTDRGGWGTNVGISPAPMASSDYFNQTNPRYGTGPWGF